MSAGVLSISSNSKYLYFCVLRNYNNRLDQTIQITVYDISTVNLFDLIPKK